ncbi:hydroxymethylbilane synthase [Gottfriedia luciferensis]|uniref:Porphobilinogen deaminase n=1 Tax=Gottfriedia luciferensis TaxID=178774 RepID=A0ABX2ZNL8_9BACI|nr:hydroxymethylbilane synthase [Gottfriedia luciferensis]ODG90325.1 hydroxymethylbilane synthase [Gottfriedia luciferensis]
MRKIIVGTRRSKLALTQTKWFVEKLKEVAPDYKFELKEIVTKGDVILDVTLSKVGGKGLFVKEIEHAMLTSEIDLAVHSMKDMPAILPEGLMIGCTPKRVDPRDALLSNSGKGLMELEEGSIVGTSSLRRSAQIKAVRPDLQIKWIRGNIDTRIQKLKDNEYDAIILAAAGLTRMGWAEESITEYIDETICVPAVGQGSLAIECRENDTEIRELLNRLNDELTYTTVETERVFLHKMEGGCQVPIAGFATIDDKDEISLTALVAKPDGTIILKETVKGTDPIEIGEKAANLLIERGAKDIIDSVKEAADE